MIVLRFRCIVFFFNDTATTEIYTLSLHDALPISRRPRGEDAPRRVRLPPLRQWRVARATRPAPLPLASLEPEWCRRLYLRGEVDRKSTRLNSSHANISYAVFCLKKQTYTL